jgi:uncharacterized protein YggE
MEKIMKLFSFLLVCLFVAGESHSQPGSSPDTRNSEITVSAEATVSADIAEFHLGIISRESLATEAFRHYSNTYESLRNSLSKLVDSTQLKTGNLFINPTFNEKNPDQTAPVYYQVSALMTLTVPLSQLNKILAKITSVEGVTISGIEFRATNQDSLQTAALEQAVRKAHEKAEAIARLEGLYDLKVKTMTTSSSRPPVPFYGARVQSIEMAPFLNASDVTLLASITVTYTATPK